MASLVERASAEAAGAALVTLFGGRFEVTPTEAGFKIVPDAEMARGMRAQALDFARAPAGPVSLDIMPVIMPVLVGGGLTLLAALFAFGAMSENKTRKR